MSSSYLSRVGLALMLAILLIGGVVLGSYVSSLGGVAGRDTEASPTPSAAASIAVPAADVLGDDFARLPRYPGSVRSQYDVFRDDRYELTASEYVVAASVGDVRVYYQTVIAEHGWERADIDYSDGQWSYVLVSGTDEALIEIERRGGLVEIDLQLSQPIGQASPAVSSAAPQTPPPAPAAPAPPQPAVGDDDDDDAGDD